MSGPDPYDAKFHFCDVRNVGLLPPPKNCEICNFWYKFVPMWRIPLSDVYKILQEGKYSPHSHARFHRSGFRNVGLLSPKSSKLVIFGIKFPLSENPEIHRKT